MTPDQIKQLRNLLKGIVKYYTKRNGQPNSPFYVRQQLKQALALLPCETCGGTKKVGTGIGEDGRDFNMRSPEILEPCSDCQNS